MPRIRINGEVFDVPENVTTYSTILRLATGGRDEMRLRITYEHTSGASGELVAGESVDVDDGTSFLVMRP